MLKMYQPLTKHGGSPDYWEKLWSTQDMASALLSCSAGPLNRLFETHVKPGTRMLEGGCGLGQHIVFNQARGARVVGLDFTLDTLRRLHSSVADLQLCGGDVAALPFADESFDAYYSGGVVEHFEAGAEAALREAARVLKTDGVLLIGVPYFSPVRRVKAFFARDWYRVSRPKVGPEAQTPEREFFQYAYTRREFSAMLRAAGLRPLTAYGYSILWGLYDLPLVERVVRRVTRSHGIQTCAAGSSEAEAAGVPAENREERRRFITSAGAEPQPLLKRMFVSEDAAIPGAGLLVRFLRWFSANMMIFVCRRIDSPNRNAIQPGDKK